jgi:hypothetical protein
MFFFGWTLGLKLFVLCLHLFGREQGKVIVEKYDKKPLFLIFLNIIIICIHSLNLKGMLLNKEFKRIGVWISLK